MKRSGNFQAGHSLSEYALMIGLLSMASFLSLQGFGINLSSLFQLQTTKLSSDNTLSLLERPTTQNPSNVAAGPATTRLNLKGSGFYAIVPNPATGKPELKLVDASGGVTNVTSVDGDQFNILGTLRIARKLDKLAEQQTDPALQDYYARMAKLAYYMGAAEGELDDVSGLSIYVKVSKYKYSNGDALQEVADRHRELATLMQNPPPNFDLQQFNQVMPLAAEVFNIGQNYLNHLDKFVASNGNVTKNFGNKVAGDSNAGSGNGTAGGSLTMVDGLKNAGKLRGTSYENFIAYDSLKSTVAGLLDNNKIKAAPVKTTLNDAREIDTVSASNSSTQ